MPIEYRIRIDENYVATALARRRSLNRGGRWFTVVKWICGLILGGLAILCAANEAPEGAAVMAGILVLLAVSGRISDGLLRRRLRKRPRFGDEVTLELSDEGIYSRDSVVESRAAWPAIESAYRVSDGWLLFDDCGRPRWLPDAATRSTPAEIEAQLRTALAERVVA